MKKNIALNSSDLCILIEALDLYISDVHKRSLRFAISCEDDLSDYYLVRESSAENLYVRLSNLK